MVSLIVDKEKEGFIIHREDGPAIEYDNDENNSLYFVNDICVSKNEYEKYLLRLKILSL